MTDKTRIVDFMKRFSFATVITAKEHVPAATHLPFLVREEQGQLTLFSHMARQNEQWQQLEANPVLVIFSEPHAYISPAHYEKELNVPTWNYLAVHAYGKATLITEPAEVVRLLEDTIDSYEAAYHEQWNRLPEKYRLGLMMGIVGFKIDVTEVQAKEKLSQNKTMAEQQNIVATLAGSTDSNERIIADYMKENLERS